MAGRLGCAVNGTAPGPTAGVQGAATFYAPVATPCQALTATPHEPHRAASSARRCSRTTATLGYAAGRFDPARSAVKVWELHDSKPRWRRRPAETKYRRSGNRW